MLQNTFCVIKPFRPPGVILIRKLFLNILTVIYIILSPHITI